MGRYSYNPERYNRPICIYDIEVFEEDWVVCMTTFSSYGIKNYEFHNGQQAKISMIIDNYTLVGFNNFYYDDVMLSKIIEKRGKTFINTPKDIKYYNDCLILNRGEYTDANGNVKRIKKNYNIMSFDLMKQLPMGTSLKKLESYNGYSIHETTVDFNIGRKLTEEELQEVIDYCWEDVKFTTKLYEERKGYFEQKQGLNEMYPFKDFGWSNTTTITDYIIGEFEKPDERIMPNEDFLNKLPNLVIDYFKNGDMSVDNKKTIPIEFKTGVGDIGGGGFHGVGNYSIYDHVLLWDGEAFYPNIMILGRMLGEKTEFLKDLLNQRRDAKAKMKEVEYGSTEYLELDKKQTLIKLILNSIYGQMKSKYAKNLFCPELQESVSIWGQVMLYDLTIRLEEQGHSIVNINTDGVAFAPKKGYDKDELYSIRDSWISDWGIDLSEERYSKFIQDSVNIYIGVGEDGKIKTKGSPVRNYGYKITDNKFTLNPKNNIVIGEIAVNTLVNNPVYDSFEEIVPYTDKLRELEDSKKPFVKEKDELNDSFTGIVVDLGEELVNQRVLESTDNLTITTINKAIKKHDKDSDIINNYQEVYEELKSVKNEIKLINKQIGAVEKELFDFIYNTISDSDIEDIFNEQGIYPFCKTMGVTNKFPLGAYLNDSNGNDIEKLHKVNRFYIGYSGNKILMYKNDEDGNVLSSTSSKSENCVIVRDDVRDYQCDFEDINLDYYKNEITSVIFNFVKRGKNDK